MSATDDNFAAAVIAARKGNGWSQSELARQMHALGYGFYQTTISKIEARTRDVRLGEAIGLCQVLDLNLADYVNEDAV